MSTSAPTTAAVVLAMVVSNLQGLSAFDDIQVSYGDTGKAERLNVIFTGNIEWSDESWADLGARSRQEQYELDGYVQVRTPGEVAQEALEGVVDLFSTVADEIRAMVQPGMGFSVALNAAFGTAKAQVWNVEMVPKRSFVYDVNDEGKAAQIDFVIRVTARI